MRSYDDIPILRPWNEFLLFPFISFTLNFIESAILSINHINPKLITSKFLHILHREVPNSTAVISSALDNTFLNGSHKFSDHSHVRAIRSFVLRLRSEMHENPLKMFAFDHNLVLVL